MEATPQNASRPFAPTATLPSIWQGSQVPETEGRIIWQDGYDTDLYDMVVNQGRPFLLIGRNSDSSGLAGCRAMAADVHEAAAVLLKDSGMDVRSLVPSVDELAHMLMTYGIKHESVTPDGVTFINRFCLVDLSAYGLIISLSAGTATKTDEDHEQPHATQIFRYLRDVHPRLAGLCARRIDRLTRVDFGLSKLFREMKQVWKTDGLWVGVSGLHKWDFDDVMLPMRLTMLMSFAASEATQFHTKTRTALVSRTKTRMVNGRVDFALGPRCPAGLMIYTDVDRDRKILAVDTPANYPVRKLGDKLPSALTRDGEPADALAALRYALAEWGKDGKTFADLFWELSDMGFSTNGLRYRHGPGAVWGRTLSNDRWRNVASRLGSRLYDDLGFYETGVISSTVDGQRIEVVDVWPEVGREWTARENLERIRDHVSSRRTRSPRSTTHLTTGRSWSSVAASLDGSPARLHWHTVASTRSESELRGWSVRPSEDAAAAAVVDTSTPARLRKSSFAPFVPDKHLFASVVNALATQNATPLRPYLHSSDSESFAMQLQHDRAKLTSEIEMLESRLARWDDALGDGDWSTESRDRLKTKMRSAEDSRALKVGQLRAVGRREEAAKPHVGLTQPDLRSLIEGLRNPAASRIGAMLARSVADLRFTTSEFRYGVLSGRTLAWTGELVFDLTPDGATTDLHFSMPFTGSYDYGSGADGDRRGLEALRCLRQGFTSRSPSGALYNSIQIAAGLLGVSNRRFWISQCNEPDLLRLWMAIAHPDPVSGEDPSEVPALHEVRSETIALGTFGDEAAVDSLIEHMRHLNLDCQSNRWLERRSKFETELLVRAGDFSDGMKLSSREAALLARTRLQRTARIVVENRDVVTIVPCSHCGSRVAARLRIREVIGLICLSESCRRDEAGVRWPERMDQYIAFTEAHVDAGRRLRLPPGFSGAPVPTTSAVPDDYRLTHPRPKRRQSDISPAERAAWCAAYKHDRDERIGDIAQRFDVPTSLFYAVIRAAGIPPRSPERSKPRTRK